MRSLVAFTFTLVLVAGCLATPGKSGSTGGASGALAYALDCGSKASDWPETCDYRASHGNGPKEEVWAAVNPKDATNAAVAAKDLNPAMSDHCVWNGIFVTKDGGKTWTDVHIGGTFASRQPGDPTYGYACNTDPDMAFAPDGTLYYAVEMYGYDAENSVPPIPDPTGTGVPGALVPGGSEFLLATSHDGGLTWPSQIVAEIGDGGIAFHDYSRMCVSPKTGTVAYAVGTYNNEGFVAGGAGAPANGAFITVVTSHDKGATADAPQLLSDPNQPGMLNIGAIACAPNGAILVSGVNINDASVWFWTSVDDGKSFTGPVKGYTMKAIAPTGRLPNTKFRAGSASEFAFDRKSSVLYATWSDNSSGNPDVVVSKSADLAKTWTSPVKVNADNTTSAQWMSNVALTDDGVVHVLYMDRHYTPGDKLIDLTYAFSTDGGATWTNTRVTGQSFDGDLGVHQAGFPFIGDYLGLSAAGDHVWGGFPDCLTGTCTVAAMHATRTA
ncbi:MAG: sialidase family protein [Thermoplasmatota archaeon]